MAWDGFKLKGWLSLLDEGTCPACRAAHGDLVGEHVYPPHPDCTAEGGCRCRTVATDTQAADLLRSEFPVRLGLIDRVRCLFGKPLLVRAEVPVVVYEGHDTVTAGQFRWEVGVRPVFGFLRRPQRGDMLLAGPSRPAGSSRRSSSPP